ncbi:MAG: DUF1553 domain-containing protein [Phycisphaeraceae bacterium]
MRIRLLGSTLACLLVLMCSSAHADEAAALFTQDVASIFERNCLRCHHSEDPRGELSLATAEEAFAGSANGRVIIAGDSGRSRLLETVVSHDGEDPEMPRGQEPLSAEEVELIRQWIDAGASWPDEMVLVERTGADESWWSLQPVVEPTVPAVDEADETWGHNAIDQFVLRELRMAGLEPSPEASRRDLIQRVYFDLIGLPPTPEEVEAFVADPDPKAYEKLVDELLDSPHYGERWARHWLDVVRFGESHGFEYNQPRDHAWHYRDWVIRVLNEDMPYDEFVRMQLAGDVISDDPVDAAAATGFLVAGAHNTTRPASERMQLEMDQDELESNIGTVAQTFLGMTVNCARCHDHKFDPISIEDYYRFASTLAGVQPGTRTVEDEAADQLQQRLALLESQIQEQRTELAAIDQEARASVIAARNNGETDPAAATPSPIASWDFQNNLQDATGNMHGTAFGDAALKDGKLVVNGDRAYVRTEPLQQNLRAKTLAAWVRLDNLEQRGGGVIGVQSLNGETFDAIVFGEREPGHWMSGSNNFARTESFRAPAETEADDKWVHLAIVYADDGTITAYRNGKPYGQSYQTDGPQAFVADGAFVTFGVRHTPATGGRMLAGAVREAKLYDRALTAEQVAASIGERVVTQEQLIAQLSDEKRAQRDVIVAELDSLLADQKRIDHAGEIQVYTQVGSGNPVARVLNRGDVSSPGEVVAPGGLTVVQTPNPDFGLEPDAAEAQRRLQLAKWITDEQNPLFSRVIANRLWHYHFGKGIVETPNDLGFSGGQPSHPELLDYLAVKMKEFGWRFKPMHRLMVTSAAYRQASDANSTAAAIDADNRLLWRFTPKRLEAEAIRDAMLAISGDLDTTIGGRGYRDVRQYLFKGSHYYEPLDESEVHLNRRTVYRFSPRGGPNPLLSTFDCPDPSTATPARAATTTPLQALSLMNNAFVFRIADSLSERVVREVGDDPSEQTRRLYELIFHREPGSTETRRVAEFITEHGLTAFVRLAFNANEFLYLP